MALGRAMTIALDGVIAHPVTVEANIGPGLPGIHIVGMADTGIGEARDRVRTAIANSQLPWPKTKIVVSLAPAALPKSGSHYDLPLALSILSAGIADPQAHERLRSTIILGELGLDGSIRPVPGVIPALVAAHSNHMEAIVVAPGNAPEASLVPGIPVLVAETLTQAWNWVQGATELESAKLYSGHSEPTSPAPLCFSDVAGQSRAKYAAEVAAAGGHHMLMIGPPGAGKSMIAARMPGILPPLRAQESLEATAIHSIAGHIGSVITQAPFVAPHSSVTRAALLGGGSGNARPGAVSLAHNGVLFLDEVSEVSARVLDALRAPLEEGEVRLLRARREVVFPARFQLVMAANPCRCGAAEPAKCSCKAGERRSYLNNISGPLRDRLDISVDMDNSGAHLSLGSAETSETSAQIAVRVAQARERADDRWNRAGLHEATNASVPAALLRREWTADSEGMELLGAYLAAGELSQRGIDKTLRLSWTLADLAARERPGIEDIANALDLRNQSSLGRQDV